MGMSEELFEQILSVMACPKCKVHLIYDSDKVSFTCPICKNTFIANHHVPIMLTTVLKESLCDQLDTKDGQEMKKRYGRQPFGFLNKIKSIKDNILSYYFPPINTKKIIDLIVNCNGNNTLAVDVGGGPTRLHDKLINLNISQFANVDIVGDALNLPFLNGSIDSVVSSSVLEHLSDPEGSVREIYRILKPGGYLFVGIPFMQVFHGYPNDYTRWTLEGLKNLCKDFEEISAGVSNGPSWALVNIIATYMTLFSNNRILKSILYNTTEIVLYPVRFFDIFLSKSENAHKVAAGVYFLGKKKI